MNLLSSRLEHMFRISSVLSEIVDPKDLNTKGYFLEGIVDQLVNQDEKIITPEGMKLAISSMKIMLRELTTKGEYKLNDFVLRNVASILKSIAQVLHTVIVDKYYTPRLRVDHVHQIARNFMDCIDMVLMASYKNVTLYPEEDVDLNQLRNLDLATADLTAASELVLYSVSLMQAPSNTNTDILSVENVSNMWTLIDSSAVLEKKTGINSDQTSIKVSSELAKSFRYQSDFLLQYTTLKENMFWWARGHINTDVVLLGFAQLAMNRKFVFLKKLYKPLSVFLKVNNVEKATIRGNVVQLDPTLESRVLDDELVVHRIIAPPLSKVYIKFNFSESKQKLRVSVLVNRRVDWNSMMESFTIISEKNNEYQVPYDTVDRENFYYMGILPDTEVAVNSSVQYTFDMYYMLCQVWMSQWISQFCLVGNETTESLLECQCTHLSIFSGAIAVPPNEVNPIQDAKLLLLVIENPVVVVLVVILLFLFILAFLWSSYRDRKDRQCREVIVLDDNYPGEAFGYLLAVYTGSRLTAGTTANVGIRLYGEKYASRPHILSSPKRKVLQTNNDDWFLLCYPTALGMLSAIELWHDNTGWSPDWFCSKIIVYDLQQKNQYIFYVEQWLALGLYEFPEAVILPAAVDEILSMKRIFLDNAGFGFRENHNWLSVLTRHPRSATTRKERLTVLFVCIMSAMLASIMFFHLSDETVPNMDEPSFSITDKEIIISVQTFLVSCICAFIVLFLFKKSYEPKRDVDNSLLYSPRRRLSEDPTEFWFYEKMKNYDLADMKAFDDKKDTRKGGFLANVANSFKKAAMAKKLQPVYLEKHPLDFHLNRTWFILAWVVSFVIIFGCAYLVSIYSMKYGPVKSQMWLTTLGFSFTQDIFIMSPIKIIIISALMSLTFERLVNAGGFQLSVQDAIKADHIGDQIYLTDLIERRQKPMYCPIPNELKSKLREKHERVMRWRALVDFVLVLVFLIVLSRIISVLWSGIHFAPNDHVYSLLTTPHATTDTGFDEIYNRTHFINYLRSTFVSSLYTYRWHDSVDQPLLNPIGQSFRRKDWCSDYTMRLVGVPRLRQLRVKKGDCTINPVFDDYIENCWMKWSDSASDEDLYGVGWNEANWEDKERFFTFWRFTEDWNSSVFSLPGKTGTVYPSGGYIVDLAASRMESKRILDTMKDLNWQDEYTRVTFAELTLYNVNGDLFTQMTLLAEHLPYGLFVTNSNVDSVNIRQRFSFWIVVYIIFMLILLIRILYKINRNGFIKFMTSFINMYELLVIFIGILCLIVYLIHLKQSSHYAREFLKQGIDQFFDFDKILDYFKYTKVCCVLLFCFTVFRMFVSWNFGRIFYTFYFTFMLSLEWIFCTTLFVCVLIFITWRFLGYLLNIFVFSNYKYVLVHYFSTKFLEEFLSIGTLLLTCIVLILALLFKVSCFIHFVYYYRVARNHNMLPIQNFNFMTFILQMTKKKKEEPSKIKVV